MRIFISDSKTEFPAINITRNIKCNFCLNEQQRLFYTYFHHGYQQQVHYCRSCIAQGVHSKHYLHLEATHHFKESIKLELPFELTCQQKKASAFILEQIKKQQTCLLYAVTGAGKTEMILDGIVEVRKKGGNVAVVSPRTDVVKELSLRLTNYLKTTHIATLYAGHSEITSEHLIISTIHQLMYFIDHFDLIIIDEIDAYPVGYDPRLMKLLRRAKTHNGIFVYLSATPPKYIRKECRQSTVYLPLRYHERPLPVPEFRFLSQKSIIRNLKKLLDKVTHKNTLLIFFNDIQLMEACYDAFPQNLQQKTICVYASDHERHAKVDAIRKGEYQFILTTTILERGFTMYGLSVWVINSHQFKSDSLIQIAGRVDRKGEKRNGEVLFFHDGISKSMIQAVKDIKLMNRRGRDVS
ncbi:DEAD/DEAH box helicase family protein [Macrococcus equi]|uniref:DEAD/DEAH box helicase family protein n=1 Tax=Macrococcus equi TaxID=3395462 RepID=UPI0039BEA91E